jgi:hypothetical protein
MREKTTKEFVASLSLPPPVEEPSTVTSGRWESSEIGRLAGAISQLGNCTQFSELAAILGNRTPAQVAVKVNDLIRAGKLRQTGPTSFTIT